jgi:uncharacterized membrane protein (UPF0182 family)
VKPRSEISPDLEAHLRYPEDMFKVQRSVLAQYHVTDPQQFYQGTNRWEVPPDPADTSELKKQPSYRLSVQMPPEEGAEAAGPVDPKFSLTSVYVPFGRKNLASFIAVDSDAASPDYGRMRILTLSSTGDPVDGPSLIANKFAADQDIQTTLQPIKLNQSVRNGNLLTLPVGGGLLYVQPVYASQTRQEGAYPVLRYVMATFGNRAGIGRTLEDALANIRTDEPVGEEPPATGEEPTPTPEPGATADVLQLLEEIETKQQQAQNALRDGNLVRYAELQEEITTLIQQAVDAARSEGAGG